MSVTTELNKHVYLADDATYDWPFTFPITDITDVEVWEKVGSALPVKITTGYTVNVSAGTVTYPNSGSPRPTGNKIILLRAVPATQEASLGTTGSSNPKNYETMFDRLTLLVQDLKEIASRCVKFPVDETPSEDDTDSFLTTAQQAVADATSEASAAATSAMAAASSASAAASSAAAAATSAASAASSASAATLRYREGDFDALDQAAGSDWFLAKVNDLRQMMVFLGDRSLGQNGWISQGGW